MVLPTSLGLIGTSIQALQRLNDLLWGSGVCMKPPMRPLSESFPFPKLVVGFAKDKFHLRGCQLAEKLSLIGLCRRWLASGRPPCFFDHHHPPWSCCLQRLILTLDDAHSL